MQALRSYPDRLISKGCFLRIHIQKQVNQVSLLHRASFLECDLCNFTGPCTQKGPALDLMLCCWFLEIVNHFEQGAQFFILHGDPQILYTFPLMRSTKA